MPTFTEMPNGSFSYVKPAGHMKAYKLELLAETDFKDHTVQLRVTIPKRAGLLSLHNGQGEVVDVPESFTFMDTTTGIPQTIVDRRYFQLIPENSYELLFESQPVLRLSAQIQHAPALGQECRNPVTIRITDNV